MDIIRVSLMAVLCASTATVDEAACIKLTTTESPTTTHAAEELLLVDDNTMTSPRYHHNTSRVIWNPATSRPVLYARLPSASSTPCEVSYNWTEFGYVSASGSTPLNDFPETGCSSQTAASSETTTQTDITAGEDGGNFRSVIQEHPSRRSPEEAANSADSIEANRKSSTKPETSEHCCTSSALLTRLRMTEDVTDSSVMTSSTSAVTTEFESHTTAGKSEPLETLTANLSVNRTRLEDYTSGDNNNSDSLWTTLALSYDRSTSAAQTSTTVMNSADDLLHNRTFNFVFDGNCLALKRRGQEAEGRFRSVVLDALSSGLSVSAHHLVAGELRCGSLNLSVTLLDASDDDVQWLMSTLAAATLRIYVEDVDETFVLSKVELIPLSSVDVAMTQVMPGRVAITTNRPGFSHESVAILVVFVIIGVLAVLAGTVSAAIYLYFRRIYCRTFVVNRRALRWSSRASDTVHVINVDDDDGSSAGGGSGGASSRAVTNDAVEWSPPISGSGFGEDRLPVGFANWSPPHYCQARFRRLIAPPPHALTSLPELLDDDEATVDIISDSSFHPVRESCIINLLQPSSVVGQDYVESADNDDDAARDADCQCEMMKQDIGSTGAVTFGWTAEKFLTSDKKERATPF